MSMQDEINLLSQCPCCTALYRRQDANLVRQESQLSIVHISCAECRHAMLLSVKKSRGGITCAGIMTDCEFEDAVRFLKADKISIDDVIRVHTALELDNFMKIG